MFEAVRKWSWRLTRAVLWISAIIGTLYALERWQGLADLLLAGLFAWLLVRLVRWVVKVVRYIDEAPARWAAAAEEERLLKERREREAAAARALEEAKWREWERERAEFRAGIQRALNGGRARPRPALGALRMEAAASEAPALAPDDVLVETGGRDALDQELEIMSESPACPRLYPPPPFGYRSVHGAPICHRNPLSVFHRWP